MARQGQGAPMIERRVLPSGRVSYRVRYHGPDGRERSKSFRRRGDAQAYEADVFSQKRRGDWVDPRRGRVLLDDVWEEYERDGMGHLRATTRENYRLAWRRVSEKFGQWPVASIEHGDIAEWVTSISRSVGPDSVRTSYGVLCRVLDHACLTRRVPVNVARGVRLPARPPARERILPADDVHRLADAMPGEEGEVVLCLVYLGLRWSELAGMRVVDVDLARRRVRVIERATEVNGRMDVSGPKSRAGHREVGIPSLIHPILERRTSGRAGDELAFPAPEGGYLRVRNWRRRSGFDRALEALGLEVTPHDLRRTFGSLARMAGADLKFIQKAMGHESITTTARIYAHLYDDEVDRVAAALDGLTDR